MKREIGCFAIDGDRQLRPHMAIFDDARIEAGAALFEVAEELVERGAGEFEVRGAGAETAQRSWD